MSVWDWVRGTRRSGPPHPPPIDQATRIAEMDRANAAADRSDMGSSAPVPRVAHARSRRGRAGRRAARGVARELCRYPPLGPGDDGSGRAAVLGLEAVLPALRRLLLG